MRVSQHSSYQKIMELFRFGVNGGVCFLVDYGLLFLLTELAGLHYLVSAAISFTVSVAVNYIICRTWVFQNAPVQGTRSKVLFIGSSVVGLGLNQLLMWIIVSRLLIHYMIAKVGVIIVVMLWNYVMKRKAIYGDS